MFALLLPSGAEEQMVISKRSPKNAFWVTLRSMEQHLGAAGVLTEEQLKKKILVFLLLVVINLHRQED